MQDTDAATFAGNVEGFITISAPSTGPRRRRYTRFSDVGVIVEGHNWNINGVAFQDGSNTPESFSIDIVVRDTKTKLDIGELTFVMSGFNGNPIVVTNNAPLLLNLQFANYHYSENEPIWRIERNSNLTIKGV